MKKQFVISSIIVILIMTGMVTLAQLVGDNEIVFPEIAALAVGTLLAPKRTWRTSLPRMVALIGLCSIFGLFMVLYVPLPMMVQILIAYGFCQILLLYSGTSFAPLISAAVLPILMETRSIIYPISAIGFTVLIVVIEYVLERTGIREKTLFVPVQKPAPKDFFHVLLRLLVVGLLGIIALPAGVKFMIAPPMIVAFTEFSREGNKRRKAPVQTVLIVFACALAGSVLRYLCCVIFQLPLAVAAFFSALFIILFLDTLKAYMPPAGALTVLAMIIPESQLLSYPFQILAGMAVFMAAALFVFPEKKTGENAITNSQP